MKDVLSGRSRVFLAGRTVVIQAERLSPEQVGNNLILAGAEIGGSFN
jgi:hypothetical protein